MTATVLPAPAAIPKGAAGCGNSSTRRAANTSTTTRTACICGSRSAPSFQCLIRSWSASRRPRDHPAFHLRAARRGAAGVGDFEMSDRSAYFRQWYAKNRERVIAKARAWELAHPEETREKKRKWQDKNRAGQKENRLRYAKSEKGKACYSRYRKTESYKSAAKQKRDHYRDTLHDCYVRRIMAQHLGIKGSEIPQVLVDAHRELMKLKRELMNEKL